MNELYDEIPEEDTNLRLAVKTHVAALEMQIHTTACIINAVHQKKGLQS